MTKEFYRPVKICDNCLCKDQPIGVIVEIVDEAAETCEWDYCVERRDELAFLQEENQS